MINDFEKYGIDINDGTQDIDQEQVYEIRLSNLRCPCCGKKFKLIDTVQDKFDDELPLTVESTILKENALSDYLMDICAQEAMDIYDNEIGSHEPEVDTTGHITSEYNERFIYTDSNLKNVIKVKANAMSNKLAQDGINIAPYYLENEIIEMLKHVN